MSVFLDFQLPSQATWFYWSLILVVTLFFQFVRWWSLRNLDLLALYLLVPGMLLVQAGHTNPAASGMRFSGYIALLSASAFWLLRSLFDGLLTRRPTYRANINAAGMVWLGFALFAAMTVATLRKPAVPTESIGKTPVAITSVKEGATAVVAQTQSLDTADATIWVERGFSLLAHFAVAAGLFTIGRRHFKDRDLGVAMATLYLLVPYTGYHFAQLHHVLPAALVVWAVACYRNPWWTGALLGLAAGATFFPVLLFPVWLRLYWKRSAWRFVAGYFAALLVGVGITILVLWSAGLFPVGFTKALHLSDWQPWKMPSAEGFWQGVHWAYRLPVFILYAGFVLTLFVWPPVRTMADAVAYSAALLIGVQFWYAERGGMYVLWYLPLLILMTLRPTAADLEPLPSNGPGRTTRWLRSTWSRVRKSPNETNPPALAG
ncbi:hypothetical protein BH11PLA2_BH11PLA2_19520 [soil metagenome]